MSDGNFSEIHLPAYEVPVRVNHRVLNVTFTKDKVGYKGVSITRTCYYGDCFRFFFLFFFFLKDLFTFSDLTNLYIAKKISLASGHCSYLFASNIIQDFE